MTVIWHMISNEWASRYTGHPYHVNLEPRPTRYLKRCWTRCWRSSSSPVVNLAPLNLTQLPSYSPFPANSREQSLQSSAG
ncbi:hypothetical protein RSAG8_02426, partial [Rhizoctonia solani AG-8 WAC10335]